MAASLRPIALAALLVTGIVVAADLPDRVPLANAASPLGQNDAGSGEDAGDAPSQALIVANSRRTFTGNLSPVGTDADWYRHASGDAFCSKAESMMSTAGVITVAADALRQSSASRGVRPQDSVTVALAAHAGQTPFFGIEPISMLSGTSGGQQSPGRYTFRFSSLGLADLDPGSDGESPEAGPTAASAVALPEECSAGRLSGAGDVADHYYYDVGDAREITLSFAVARGPDDAVLTFVSPSGVVAASIRSGQSVDVYASEVGRWNVVVSRPEVEASGTTVLAVALAGVHAASSGYDTTQDIDYLIGFTGGPDPCRPSC